MDGARRGQWDEGGIPSGQNRRKKRGAHADSEKCIGTAFTRENKKERRDIFRCGVSGERA